MSYTVDFVFFSPWKINALTRGGKKGEERKFWTLPPVCEMWTEIWLLCSCLAHLHGSLPWIAAEALGDATNQHPVLAAYRKWCLTDKRYCARDPCVMTFQGLTALYGVPLCLSLVVAIRFKLWWRHLNQVLLCIPQMYGTLIYFGSAAVKNFEAIDSDPVAFWGLFFGLNFLWVLIPMILLCQSLLVIGRLLKREMPSSSLSSPQAKVAKRK